MPSLLHEVLLELIRDQPALLPMLLREVAHLQVPESALASVARADLNQLVPAEFRADLVLLVGAPTPFMAAVIESQSSVDPDKLWSWPVYAATLRARHRCPAIVVVITVDHAVMRWASRPIELGAGSALIPVVLGPGTLPRVADVETARQWPELALLSALAYGQEPGATELVAPIKAALDLLDKTGDGLYLEVVTRALNDAARRLLEAMMQIPKDFQYTFRPLREAYEKGLEQGEARGEARGKALDVLRIFEKRQIAVPEPAKERILACTDLELLACWFDRALFASTIEEVLDG